MTKPLHFHLPRSPPSLFPSRQVERLCDCPACAECQAAALDELARPQEAADTRRLGQALAELREQLQRVRAARFAAAKPQSMSSKALIDSETQQQDLERAISLLDPLRESVAGIRAEITAKGNWYYGSKAHAASVVPWPDGAVKHTYGKFSQPLCHSCRRYRLDYNVVMDNVKYVLYEGSSEEEFFNGIRDQGRPAGCKLDFFVDAPEAREADLSEAEVAALRIYTSHAFGAFNEPLRDTERAQEDRPHPLPVLTTLLDNAVKKLRAVGKGSKAATSEVVLWRGFRDMQVTPEFLANGGTEPAPMSATRDSKVAAGYAIRNGQTSRALLFKIVTDNNLQRGANLDWVSMFPGEKETLYPPLVFMQATGETETNVIGDVTLDVVEIKVTIG
jgi:hypothetical protein